MTKFRCFICLVVVKVTQDKQFAHTRSCSEKERKDTTTQAPPTIALEYDRGKLPGGIGMERWLERVGKLHDCHWQGD